MTAVFACTITRAALGLPDLDINDGVNYKVVKIEPGRLQWRRQTTSSPYVDGDFTTQRSKGSPTAAITIEVRGTTHAASQTAYQTLVDAFEQDTFVLTFSFDGAERSWYGEAADRENAFEKERVHARKEQVRFEFPRLPTPVLGVV